MQSDKINEAVKDLTTRLTSLDPVEYNSAVNIYFEPSVVFQSGPVLSHGATAFKKILGLTASLTKESKVEGQPKWDEKNQTITYDYYRLLTGPKLPGWVPMNDRIASLTYKLKEHSVLHLNPSEEDGAKTFYVTKVANLPVPAKNIPVVGYAVTHIVSPIVTLFLLLFANTVTFFHRHPLSQGIIPFLVAAIYETVHTTASYLQSISSRQMVATEKWQKDRGIDMKDMVSKARSTALETQNNLEARARSAGIPVDEYKQKASDLFSDAKSRASGVAKQAEAQAQATKKTQHHGHGHGHSHSHTHGQGDKHETTHDSVEARPGIIKSTELAPLGKGIFEPEHTSNDSDKPVNDITNTGPITPLGGHNPLADNASSYAEAAQP